MAAMLGVTGAAAATPPRHKQGIPSTPPPGTVHVTADDWGDFPVPDDMPAPDGEFTFDMIKNWSGEGDARAALVIQWNDDRETNALVFGYRWDSSETKTGIDMIRAVVANNPRLYGLIQATDVGGPVSGDVGYTVNGFGWDLDEDEEIALVDSKDGMIYTSETGLIEHPRGIDSGSIDYDYDDWVAMDTDDFWGAGWYISYWSYWVKDNEKDMFSYSGWGASNRVLQDGSWDGWNFAVGMMPYDWKEFVAAPELIPAGAKTQFTVDGICYDLQNYSKKTVKVVAPRDGSHYQGIITIPATFTDENIEYIVVAVDDDAFAGTGAEESLEVTLPATVTQIGARAFKLSALSRLQVAGSDNLNTITKIGESAFYGCDRLTAFNFPQSITAIPDNAFWGTRMQNLTIPDVIETIGVSAFAYNTAATTLSLPAGIKAIGGKAFEGLEALTEVHYLATIPVAVSDDVFSDYTYTNAQMTVPYGCEGTFAATAGWKNFVKVASETIPVNDGDLFVSAGVTYQVVSATDRTVKVTHCKVDGNADNKAIEAANLAGYKGDLVIPATVSYQKTDFTVISMDSRAFDGAADMTSLNIEAALTEIPEYAFYNCSALISVTLPAGVKTVGTYAFSYAGITSVTLPEGVTTLGERAFFQCAAMESISLPGSVTTLGNNCFAYCQALKSISLGDNITSLGSTMFQNCSSLVSVKLPAGLTTIPASTFNKCVKLAEVSIPATVTAIKGSAFSGCYELDVKLPAAVKEIGAEAFKDCRKITEFTFPEGITTISNGVLYGCSSLTKVTMSDAVTSLGNNLFRGTGLTEYTVGPNVKKLGTSVFADSKNLTLVTLPEGLTEIGSNCFQNCLALTTLDIPLTVTKIGTNCFQGSGLTAFTWPEAIKTIPSRAFADCTSLAQITLPEALTKIDGYAFQNCTALKEIVLPAATALGGNDTFGNNPDIKVYATATTTLPSCYTYALRASGSGTSAKYVNLIVPTGMVDAYKAKASWNKAASVTAPGLTGIAISDVAAVGSNAPGEVNIAGKAGLTYNIGQLPEQFARVNDALLLKDFTATVKFGETVAEALIDPVAGTFTATLPVVEPLESVILTITSADGAAVYSSEPAKVRIPSAVNAYVDMSKVGYTVGEGDLSGALLVSWNDTDRGVDHLLWGVNFAAGATPQQIVNAVVEADPRFYALDEGGYAYDVLDKGDLSEQYDHYSVNSTDNEWHIYSDETPGHGSVIYLTYGPVATEAEAGTETVAAAPAYTFYIPAADRFGAWVPDNYRLPIADDMKFPVWARVGAYGLKDLAVTFDPSRPYVAAGAAVSGSAMIAAQLPCTADENPAPEVYDLKVSIAVSSANPAPEGLAERATLDDGGQIAMAIVEPVKPVTKISDTRVLVAGTMEPRYLNELMDYEPKDATYTGMELWRLDTKTFKPSEKIDIHRLNAFDEGYEGNLNKVEVKAGAKDQIYVVRSILNPDVWGMVSFEVNPAPVTEVYLDGIEGDEIVMTAHDILALSPAALPVEAVNAGVALSIENATAENMVNAYPVGGARKFTELVTYAPGSFDLVLTSTENADVTRRYHVTVNPLDSTPPDDNYEDGTFWLNEDWFTHKNGSVNYLKNPLPQDDSDIIYRAYGCRNDGAGFGATSQYGMVFAGKLFVMSKQEHDAGDIRGVAGGRVTIADARTLRRITSFDNIGGDGRACVGVSAHKAYLGTNAGIRVLTWDDDNNFTLADSDIPGINNNTGSTSDDIAGNESLYNKQIGDMVYARGRVFAIQQGVGLHIIDAVSDTKLLTVDDAGVQGIVQDSEGYVWVSTITDAEAGKSILRKFDPQSLVEVDHYTVNGRITCSWGAWRSTNFFASRETPVLFWTASGGDMQSSGSSIYKWNIGTDGYDLQPLYTLPREEGMDPGVYRFTYASMRYDDRTGHILFDTTTSPSGNYRYNWYNFVDAESGERTSCVALKPYYWFPAVPVFPDKYAPEFGEIKALELYVSPENNAGALPGEEFDINVTDADNIDANITVTLQSTPELEAIADVTLLDRHISVMPKAKGESSLTLVAESNGRTTTVNVPVQVLEKPEGVEAVSADGGVITVRGNRVNVRGMMGAAFTVYDMSGREVSAFEANSDDTTVMLAIPAGTYVLRETTGVRTLKFVLK